MRQQKCNSDQKLNVFKFIFFTVFLGLFVYHAVISPYFKKVLMNHPVVFSKTCKHAVKQNNSHGYIICEPI